MTTTPAPSAKPHHVVIVGAGFGGLETAFGLAGAPVDITLIDRRNHHLFQPLLYQVATTSLGPSEIAWPLRQLVHKRPEGTAPSCPSTTSSSRPARSTPISATTRGSPSRPASRRSKTRPPCAAACS